MLCLSRDSRRPFPVFFISTHPKKFNLALLYKPKLNFLCACHEGLQGSGDKSPLTLYFRATWRCEIIFMDWLFCCLGMNPRYLWNKRNGLEDLENTKSFVLPGNRNMIPPWSNPQPIALSTAVTWLQIYVVSLITNM